MWESGKRVGDERASLRRDAREHRPTRRAAGLRSLHRYPGIVHRKGSAPFIVPIKPRFTDDCLWDGRVDGNYRCLAAQRGRRDALKKQGLPLHARDTGQRSPAIARHWLCLRYSRGSRNPTPCAGGDVVAGYSYRQPHGDRKGLFPQCLRRSRFRPSEIFLPISPIRDDRADFRLDHRCHRTTAVAAHKAIYGDELRQPRCQWPHLASTACPVCDEAVGGAGGLYPRPRFLPLDHGGQDRSGNDRTGSFEVGALLGAEDAWPVACEPFSQWVIEDDFPSGRPSWNITAQLSSAMSNHLTHEVALAERCSLRHRLSPGNCCAPRNRC